MGHYPNNSKKPKWVQGALILLAAMLLLVAACSNDDNQVADDLWDDGPTPPMRMEPAEPAPDFDLTDQHGEPFRLSDQQGKAVVLFFGYTTCPDVCPLTLGKLQAVKSQLGDYADDARFVFVTVDPNRDGPEELAKMIKRFGDEEFIGVTGDPKAMVKVWNDYNVFVNQTAAEKAEHVPEDHYWVEHSSWVYLISPEGIMTLMYSANFDIARMAQDITEMIEG